MLISGAAQALTHSVSLAWTDPNNPAGTTYSVYRATGLCSGNPSYSKIATGIVGKTYVDTTVTPGNYCYYGTATFAGMESGPSPTAGGAVPSFPPATLQVTVQ